MSPNKSSDAGARPARIPAPARGCGKSLALLFDASAAVAAVVARDAAAGARAGAGAGVDVASRPPNSIAKSLSATPLVPPPPRERPCGTLVASAAGFCARPVALLSPNGRLRSAVPNNFSNSSSLGAALFREAEVAALPAPSAPTPPGFDPPALPIASSPPNNAANSSSLPSRPLLPAPAVFPLSPPRLGNVIFTPLSLSFDAFPLSFFLSLAFDLSLSFFLLCACITIQRTQWAQHPKT